MSSRALLPVCPLLAAASLVSAAPAPLPTSAGGGGGDEILHWRKKRHALDELPAEIPGATREAVERFGSWASSHDYHLHLNEECDVVLITRESKRPKREQRIIEKADAYLDELLTLESELAGDAPAASARDDMPLVLVQARSQPDYSALVDHVVDLEPHLASWSSWSKRDAGFVLQEPLCAAWMEDPPGVEEWSPDNELVHRMARLRLLRSFGHLPNWVTLGVAWAAEETIGRGIYCFPYRDGFVGVGEHSGWSRALKRLSGKEEDVDFSIVSSWQRGTWDKEAARYSFGVVRLFERTHPGTLAGFLGQLRETYEEKRIERFADGSWKIHPGYEVSHQDQMGILEETLGEDVFKEMATFFKKGMPKAKRKKRS